LKVFHNIPYLVVTKGNLLWGEAGAIATGVSSAGDCDLVVVITA
jgi:hypothetical protein